MNTIKKSARDALFERAKAIVRLDASGGIINMQAAVEILMTSGVSKERARAAVRRQRDGCGTHRDGASNFS